MFVRQPCFRNAAPRHFEGSAGQQRVPESFIRDSMIPLPAVAEQSRIAESVRTQIAEVARMRRAEERELEAIQILPGALLRDVFGGFEPPGSAMLTNQNLPQCEVEG